MSSTPPLQHEQLLSKTGEPNMSSRPAVNDDNHGGCSGRGGRSSGSAKPGIDLDTMEQAPLSTYLSCSVEYRRSRQSKCTVTKQNGPNPSQKTARHSTICIGGASVYWVCHCKPSKVDITIIYDWFSIFNTEPGGSLATWSFCFDVMDMALAERSSAHVLYTVSHRMSRYKYGLGNDDVVGTIISRAFVMSPHVGLRYLVVVGQLGVVIREGKKKIDWGISDERQRAGVQ